jgi:uncharacterized protein (TIGR02611 family)
MAEPQHDHRLRRTRDVWGDDQEERDATQVVAEFEADAGVQRRWHEHPAWAPVKVVWRFIKRNGKRVGVTIAGFAVLIAGIAMLVLPGPGWVAIFLGLGILSTEYVWAQRLLAKAKAKAEQAKNAVFKKKDAAPEATAEGGPPEP